MAQHQGFDMDQSTFGITWKTESITSTSGVGGTTSSTWKLITYITTNGDEDEDNVTLVDAPAAGMLKIYIVKALGHANDTVKVTPTNLNGASFITFNGVGQGCILSFDGTNWNILSIISGNMLARAEIYAYDVGVAITIAAAGKANKVQITSFTTNGAFSNMTPDHSNDHITVVRAGIYLCTASIHIESVGGGGADEFGFSVWKNNGATEFQNCHGHRLLAGGGGDTGSVGLSGHIDLAVNDTIEVWCWNEDSTDNLIIDDITLSLVQIGGV